MCLFSWFFLETSSCYSIRPKKVNNLVYLIVISLFRSDCKTFISYLLKFEINRHCLLSLLSYLLIGYLLARSLSWVTADQWQISLLILLLLIFPLHKNLLLPLAHGGKSIFLNLTSSCSLVWPESTLSGFSVANSFLEPAHTLPHTEFPESSLFFPVSLILMAFVLKCPPFSLSIQIQILFLFKPWCISSSSVVLPWSSSILHVVLFPQSNSLTVALRHFLSQDSPNWHRLSFSRA